MKAADLRDRHDATLARRSDLAVDLVWNDWRAAPVVVKPGTVIAWHRRGFRLFWT